MNLCGETFLTFFIMAASSHTGNIIFWSRNMHNITFPTEFNIKDPFPVIYLSPPLEFGVGVLASLWMSGNLCMDFFNFAQTHTLRCVDDPVFKFHLLKCRSSAIISFNMPDFWSIISFRSRSLKPMGANIFHIVHTYPLGGVDLLFGGLLYLTYLNG